MDLEKVSVIIPIWKPNFVHLKKCLDSMVNQTYKKLEIIIVYRKSIEHDNKFFSFMKGYDNDSRIKVLEGQKKGFVNALNEGIENANGEFIGRLDADDYSSLDRFEKQLDFKKKHGLNVVGSWAYWISEKGDTIGKIRTPIEHSEIRKKIMFHCPLLHPTILMDRKMLDKEGAYNLDFVHAEDYELFFKLISKNYRFGNIPEFLCNIREDPQSRSRGEEWRKQRIYYIKAKNKAFFEYGFNKPRDLLYHTLTPISYFMSPKIWLKLRKFVGWKKE